MSTSSVQQDRLRAVVEPIVSDAGLEIDSLTVTAAGRRSVIRLTVDSDAGVDLDAVAKVSRTVSDALDADAAAAFSGPYSLEVSSPGVDRPLTEPRHWRRSRGRLVKVDVSGQQVTGRVVDAADAGVTLRTEKNDDQLVAWDQLGAGHIEVEFNRPTSWDEGAGNSSADTDGAG